MKNKIKLKKDPRFPITYSFFKVHSFQNHLQQEQLTMGFDNHPSSRKDPISINQIESFGKYKQYEIKFDERVNYKGYFTSLNNGQIEYKDVSSFYVPHRFKGYLYGKTILFNVSYKVTNKLLKEIDGIQSKQKESRPISLDKYEFELDEIMSNWQVRGLWLGFDDKPNLGAAGMFGLDVQDDINVLTLKKDGGITTAVVISYVFKGNPYTITISKNCSISISTKVTIKDSLEIVEDLLKNIVL